MPTVSYSTDYTEHFDICITRFVVPGDPLPPRNRGLFYFLSPYHTLLESAERDTFVAKYVSDARVDLGTAGIRSGHATN